MLPESNELELEVQRSVWTGRTKVFANGKELMRQKQGGHYEIELNDGTVRVMKVKGSSFDGIPKIFIDDKQIQVARKLSTLEYIAAVIPMALVIVGGAIGGLFGALATVLNFRIIRSNLSTLAKVLIIIISTMGAGALYFVFSVAFLTLIN
jgi:hypothetical protein